MSGLERVYNQILTGTPAEQLWFGRRLVAATRPRPGETVRTTIDPRLQAAATGGLGIWGGVAGGAAAGLWVLRKHLSRADVLRFMDTVVAPGLLVAQAIGRIGNYFNQELYGAPSSLPWALEISPAHRVPGYLQYATFEPTFLYELIWNLLLAGALVWLGNHRRIKPPGLFALYVAGYSGFRIFEETQRIDYSQYILGMRLNFFIATLLCLTGQPGVSQSNGAGRWRLSRSA